MVEFEFEFEFWQWKMNLLWKTMAWFKSWLNVVWWWPTSGSTITNNPRIFICLNVDVVVFFLPPLKLINSFVQSSLGYKSIHLFIRFRILCIFFVDPHLFCWFFLCSGTICYIVKSHIKWNLWIVSYNRISFIR